jgi:hypothetical protein
MSFEQGRPDIILLSAHVAAETANNLEGDRMSAKRSVRVTTARSPFAVAFHQRLSSPSLHTSVRFGAGNRFENTHLENQKADAG